MEENKQEEFEMTEYGNSMLLNLITDGKLKNIYEDDNTWISWDGKKWNESTGFDNMKYYQLLIQYYKAATLEAYKIVEELGKDPEAHMRDTLKGKEYTAAKKHAETVNRWQKQCQNHNTYMNSLRFLRVQPDITVNKADLDAKTHLLGVKNGVVNIKTGQLLEEENAKKAMITQSCAVEYNPKSSKKEWNKLIVRLMCNDKEKVKYLQTVLGSALVGNNSDHFMFILGDGSNGKTTVLELLSRVLGDYAVAGAPEMFSRNVSDKKEYYYAAWKGKRLLVFNETDKKSLSMSESLIKQTTDSGIITARYPSGRPFEYLPQFTPVFSVNHMPEMGTDPATWRRVGILSFDYKVKDEDKETGYISRMFDEHGEGILQWLIDGALMYLKDGITIPNSVKVLTTQVKDDSDEVKKFLMTLVDVNVLNCRYNLNVVIDNKVKLTDLLKAFTQYCEDNNLSRKISSKNMAAELRQIGLDVSLSTGKVNYIFGLRTWLNHNDSDDNEPLKGDEDKGINEDKGANGVISLTDRINV